MKQFFQIFILSIFIALPSAQNDTTSEPTTTTTETDTTQMYTSALSTLSDLTAATDPLDDIICSFEYMVTLNDGEDIVLTLCGYTASNDEKMVGITVKIPSDSWVGIGFILPQQYDATNKMKGAYTFILNPNSRVIKETNFSQHGNSADLLKSTVELYEDVVDGGSRIIKFKRKMTLSISDLDASTASDIDKYLDFLEFIECDDELQIIWAFGKKPNMVYPSGSVVCPNLGLECSPHGSNAGVVTARVDKVGLKRCSELGDNAYSIKMGAMTAIVIAIIAMLGNY